MKRFQLALLATFFSATTLLAQPPNIDGNRWTGNTAIAPIQGNFNQGTPLTLTWGFMALNTPINDSASSGFANANNNLPTYLNGIYGSQAVWQPQFQSVFDRWSSISGLTYQFEANDDGATFTASTAVGQRGSLGVRADLRIGGKALDGNSNVLAYNYFPTVGDMVLDTSDNFFTDTSNNSLRLRNVAAHEHGHGLGMQHVDPSVGKTLMEPFVSTAYNGPQFHDILVAQRAYGDALEKSNAGLGNDTAALATSLGAAMGIGQSRTIGTSAGGPKTNMANNNNVVAFTATDFISIDSTTDTDFYSFTTLTPGRLTVLLEALGITYDARVQNSTTAFNFNARNRSDLKLALFDTNGTTILLSVDATTFGGDETLTFDLLTAGTYFVRVTGFDNPDTATTLDTQFYGLTVSLAAIPEPTTIALIGMVGLGGYGYWKRRKRQHEEMLNGRWSRLS
ncbi:MAG: matrixin family metalloprotease [Gemmatales bacterium]